MKWSNYSTLKSASKVGFEKVAEESKDGVVLKPAHIVLSKKQFDSETGEALSDSKREISLKELEYEKASYDSEMAKAKAESDELAKAIEDFKKL
tara:strand:- start:38 stop:319 length:282 start_codon:yes stop_codon:yes gene_type:complete